ncbi:MAG: hypothetical protein JRF50_15050 [Deltaproteobacteria bacterium]|nr:hypothetical protein [Deltaproteobacteria bacterium]
MSQIIYENDAAILSFDYPYVTNFLTNQIAEHNLEDDSLLLKWLEKTSDDGNQDITITDEDQYEGIEYVGRMMYVIRDLLRDEKGDIYCKTCGRAIALSKLKIRQVTPFDYHKGVDKKAIKRLKKEFGLRGRVRLPGSGGTTFLCDKGHELFGTRDWIT